MLIAHYIGPAKPGVLARIGWWAITTAQKSPFGHCTHTEAIHAVHGDGLFDIASSSLMDKGVRVKRQARLQPERWVLTDVPAWDVRQSVDWFDAAIKAGVSYDSRGALATMLPGRQDASTVFCTEAVLSPFVVAPHYYSPALGLSLCLSIGRDVTREFLPG